MNNTQQKFLEKARKSLEVAKQINENAILNLLFLGLIILCFI